MSDYKNFTVVGPTSLERFDKPLPVWSTRIILLGITGTGKSNFLECLANDRSLALSKNQLESVTQKVECYRLVNVKKKLNIGPAADVFIIDTPGFSDRKMSEKKVVSLIHEWVEESQDSLGLTADRALYFDRITDIRASGSKRRAQALFQMITGNRCARKITLVTTMWDTLWNDDQMLKADNRFEEYRRDIWADLISRGSACTKFHNNPRSALEVLDYAFNDMSYTDRFDFEKNSKMGINKAPYAQYLMERLLERIASLEAQLRTINDFSPTHLSDEDVETSCQAGQERIEVEELLADAKRELEDFETTQVLEAVGPGFRNRVSKWLRSIRSGEQH